MALAATAAGAQTAPGGYHVSTTTGEYVCASSTCLSAQTTPSQTVVPQPAWTVNPTIQFPVHSDRQLTIMYHLNTVVICSTYDASTGLVSGCTLQPGHTLDEAISTMMQVRLDEHRDSKSDFQGCEDTLRRVLDFYAAQPAKKGGAR